MLMVINLTVFLICLKIFFARMTDVCLGTFRTVNVVKGNKGMATLIAFIEVFIWYMVAKEALNPSIKSIFVPIAYAGGFATGTYLGMLLSARYIDGHLTVNVISSTINENDILTIKEHGFGVSMLNTHDNKTLLILEINKKHLKELRKLIKSIDENSFITVNETKYVHNGFIK